MKPRSEPSAETLARALQTSVPKDFGALAAKAGDPVDPAGEDARLTVLPETQFDALLEMLDNPPEPSARAREAVARARRW